MSVFYKFKSALTFDTIQFDDLHISLQEFKKAVIQRSQPGKSTNFDLQVTNAETNEVYSDENALIPKNSSLIVVRVPLAGTSKKAWDTGDHVGSKIGVISSDYLQENPGSVVVKSADLAALNASEEDKIKAMMFQSNVDYDPANYSRMKGGAQKGDPPPNYMCHKCEHHGHWIKDCPITVVPDIKKSSGIPQSFMTPVEDASVPGALMTPTGTFAVPTIDMHAYKEGKKEKPFSFSEESETSSKPIIPEDLLCTICQDILTDAVMMPCCGNSFCDECIRNILIESEENQCPDCKEKDTSPETLIPNRFLRNAVNTFRNKSGYKGGGHRVKRNEREAKKSPTIEEDQDVEIIGTIAVEPVKKIECEPASEKGSAIVVLGADVPGSHLRPTNWVPTNGSQKLPNIHVENRPPLGRPKMPPEGMGPDSSRPIGYVSCPPTTVSLGRPNLSTVVISSNGVRLSPDMGGDSERKRSSPLSHPTVVNRLPQMPNTSQLPPGYNPSSLPPMNSSYGGNVRPIMPTYGPPGGVNTMQIPQHMSSQSGPPRMYPPYSNQNMYPSQMSGNYRSAPGHPRMRPHHTNPYGDRPIVEDPLEAFERHLRERERQDRLRRTRNRRSRSRSASRVKSRSRSRQRSRSRSVSKKRTHSKSLSPRKESPKIKRDSRSPVRRSKSRSRSRSRARSESVDRKSMPPSKSPSPGHVSKKKRPDSLSPTNANFKKRSRSASPLAKKTSRAHRSRSRSKSASRTRKRRRTRSRSRSVSSRGRSFSRSPSPHTRPFRSPSHSHRIKRNSRSPPRHQFAHQPRHRGHYPEPAPYHNQSNFYDQNDHRFFKRGGRGSRFPRGNRYQSSNQMYDGGHNKYDRYAPNNERFDDKRFADVNNRPFYPPNEQHPRRRENYHHNPPPAEFEQYYNYGEVAPPGTTDLNTATVHYATPYTENVTPLYPERRSGSMDRYHRRSPVEYDDRNAPRAFKEPPHDDYKKAAHDDYKKPPHDDYKKPRDYEKERRRSRERHHSHHREPERKRHSSRSRAPSQSPPHRSRKHRSRGRSVDKENKSTRVDRGTSNKRESVDRSDDHVLHEKLDQSSEAEKRYEPEDRKEEYKEKKEKSKHKKKKESDVEKKKRKKVKTSKKDEGASKVEEPLPPVKEEELSEQVSDENRRAKPMSPVKTKTESLYADMEGASVDTSIIENYGKMESDEEVPPEKPKDLILAAVPELSKWERDDMSSPADDRSNSRRTSDDKKMVTTEILKRAENALFQKSSSKSSRSDVKSESALSKEELESTREARKSGNSIQVTVPAAKPEDDRAFGRISAKDRLGAKVEERNYATVRSLVEPKIKPRPLSSTVKCVADAKHPKEVEKRPEPRKVEEKRRKESRHEVKLSKHRSDPKEKSKREEDHHLKKEKEKPKKPEASEVHKGDVIMVSSSSTAIVSSDKSDNSESRSNNEVKSILEKKRPCLDEATFEPDYDLTSESEGEVDRKVASEPEEPVRKPEVEVKTVDRTLTPKVKEQSNEASSSESTSDSSTDSSAERRKRKKRKSKKKKRVKKRKTYSSDSESEESSDSDSDSDAKSKRKKKHRHKTRKTSRSVKKKKRNKHR